MNKILSAQDLRNCRLSRNLKNCTYKNWNKNWNFSNWGMHLPLYSFFSNASIAQWQSTCLLNQGSTRALQKSWAADHWSVQLSVQLLPLRNFWIHEKLVKTLPIANCLKLSIGTQHYKLQSAISTLCCVRRFQKIDFLLLQCLIKRIRKIYRFKCMLIACIPNLNLSDFLY